MKILVAVLAILVIIYGGYRVVQHYGGTKQTAITSPTYPSPSATALKEMTVVLAEENQSSESGTAKLSESNGKTMVIIDLTGFTPDVPQPAHIHVGACPGVGAIKYPLTVVVNGKSVTVLDVPLDQLRQNLPLAINVHKSAAEITNYTACGELSSK